MLIGRHCILIMTSRMTKRCMDGVCRCMMHASTTLTGIHTLYRRPRHAEDKYNTHYVQEQFHFQSFNLFKGMIFCIRHIFTLAVSAADSFEINQKIRKSLNDYGVLSMAVVY